MSSYETVFDDPALETQAKNVCSDDKFCLYDVAATGNIDIGMSTLSTGKEIERTARLSNPEIGLIACSTIIIMYQCILVDLVICDPACFNGMCIRNDTCQCITGYTGALCNEEGKFANNYYDIHCISILLQHSVNVIAILARMMVSANGMFWTTCVTVFLELLETGVKEFCLVHGIVRTLQLTVILVEQTFPVHVIVLLVN